MSEPQKIPHYINNPETNRLTAPENKLYRPQINFVRAAFVMIFAVSATLIASFTFAFFLKKKGFIDYGDSGYIMASLSIYWKLQLAVLVLTLRFIFIWFIRIYQRYAKSETRLRCCYTPSCSEYAILSLKKYGLIIGCIKAIRRLLRCGPPGGIDYP